ncbi:MAG: hypothetical protein NC930_06900 [Candidatus Omnitrophica bacterium]|nr:hypothetical protein [Candidatus Omnitrophota bacterium]
MTSKIIRTLGCLLLVFSSSAFAKEPVFQVEVQSKTPQVTIVPIARPDYYAFYNRRIKIVKLIADFTLTTRIKNISSQEQTLSLWSCAYGYHWVPDDYPVVYTGVEMCLDNMLEQVTRKPSEWIERDLLLGITESAKPGKITFRLGFRPIVNTGKKGEAKIRYGDVETWSNPVTVELQAGPQK